MAPALAPGAGGDSDDEAPYAGCGASFDLAADDKGRDASAAAADAAWLAGGAVRWRGGDAEPTMLGRRLDTACLPTGEGDRLPGVARSLAAKGSGPVPRRTGDPGCWEHALVRRGGTSTLPGSVVKEPTALAPKGRATEHPGVLHREGAITPPTSTGLLLLTEHLAGEGVARMARSIDSEPPSDVRRKLLLEQAAPLGGEAAVAGVEHTAGVADAGKVTEPALVATTTSACCLPRGGGELA